jgi:hypothetical protein
MGSAERRLDFRRQILCRLSPTERQLHAGAYARDGGRRGQIPQGPGTKSSIRAQVSDQARHFACFRGGERRLPYGRDEACSPDDVRLAGRYIRVDERRNDGTVLRTAFLNEGRALAELASAGECPFRLSASNLIRMLGGLDDECAQYLGSACGMLREPTPVSWLA